VCDIAQGGKEGGEEEKRSKSKETCSITSLASSEKYSGNDTEVERTFL